MSHELEIIDGQAQVMLRQDAWHKLGTVVGAAFTWLDALANDLAITWKVEKRHLADFMKDEFVQFLDDQYVAYRPHDNTIIASGHGDNWHSFNPEIAYEFVTYLRDEWGIVANLESLGSIRGGKQWFMTFESGSFNVGGYDITSHLTASGSYDQSWPFLTQAHEIVAVCANTITAVRHAGKQLYRFKNTLRMEDRIDAAKAVVKLQRDREVGFKALADKLLVTKVTPAQYGAIIEDLFPVGDDVPVKTSNVNASARDKVEALYTAQSGIDVVQGVEGTGWALLQSVNTYENWGGPIRKAKGFGTETTRALRQIDSVIEGKQPLTDRVLELVLAA